MHQGVSLLLGRQNVYRYLSFFEKKLFKSAIPLYSANLQYYNGLGNGAAIKGFKRLYDTPDFDICWK